jgi:hypothetical protein
MKKTLSLLCIGLIALLAACDRKPDQASARERKTDLKPQAKVESSRWKQTDGGNRTYGIIVEQDAGRVTANLYTLEDGEGLVIREKEAQGKYYADKKAIIFALYHPAAIAPEKWIAEGGPHLTVPWEPGASKITATWQDPTRTNTLNFARLESVTPTFPTTTTGAK